jgi:hypothetical protein
MTEDVGGRSRSFLRGRKVVANEKNMCLPMKAASMVKLAILIDSEIHTFLKVCIYK